MTQQQTSDLVSKALAASAPFDLEIAKGRLTIEERHPFLCLHRGPTDRSDLATADLLLGQASFAIAPPATPYSAEFAESVHLALSYLAQTFQTVLLLEIFALEQESTAHSPDAPLRFECRMPEGGSVDAFLHELERAVVAESWLGGRPEIIVSYERTPRAGTLRPFLPASVAEAEGIVPVSIGLSPIYRDPMTGETLPVVHREFRILFGRVLKKALYAFCQSGRAALPPHYHALGRTRVDESIVSIDRDLCRLGENLDPLLYATPVNVNEAWNRFRSDKYQAEPKFHYRPLKIDPAQVKRDIYQIPIEEVEDPTLHRFFASKRTELDRFATLLEDRETDRFVLASRQIYGAPDEVLISQAKRILEEVPAHTQDDRASDALDAEAFAAVARRDISHYGLEPDTVEIRDDIPGIMVSKGRFLIGRKVKVPRLRVRATLNHEIGVHVLTHRNGAEQPFGQLSLGMAGYEEFQEGIAVFAEYCSGGLTRPRWRQIAGRVVAVTSLVAGAGFLDIFRLLHRDWHFGKRAAFTMTMRVMRGGGFTKDMGYLRGLQSVVDYLCTHRSIEPLLIGKVSYDHLDVLEELTWRGLLRPARYKPAVFQKHHLDPMIDRIIAGGGLREMIESTASCE